MIDWKIDSWRQFPIKQVPEYSDVSSVTRVEKELSVRPPLVFAEEARRLRKRMADVAEGKAFLLQGGDCAESFAEHNANNIRDSFRVLLQMAVVLTFGSALPVIKIGRLAGQYSKPRSSPFEVINDISLPSYRGDMVNNIAFEKEARLPDPERLIKVYDKSAATLNLLRAFASGGMADLTKLHEWNLEFVRGTKAAEKIREILISEKMNSISEILLNFAARKDHIENLIKPQISSKNFVISDRFFDSTFAYQGFGFGTEINIIEQIKNLTIDSFSPDITFFIDINIEVMQQRIFKRSSNNKYEDLSLEFHQKVRKGFLDLWKKNYKEY